MRQILATLETFVLKEVVAEKQSSRNEPVYAGFNSCR